MQMMMQCTLPVRLLTVHKNLLETGFYLSDNAVLDNVHWVRDGHADHLVANVVDIDSTTDSYPSPPPDSVTEIDLAPLCAIMRICTHDFWLMSEVNYCPGFHAWQELVNVNPSCTVEEPDPQPVHSDFGTVMQKL